MPIRSAWYRGLCLLSLVCCSDSHDSQRTQDMVDCGGGLLVESEAGPVCVFRRSSPLVIEGGFNCPPELDVRTDLASAIACSARAFDLLPEPVCAAIDGACDAAKPGVFAMVAPAQEKRTASTPRYGGPGECVSGMVCSSAADCVIVASNPTADADNYACTEGRCEYLGCRDDAECAASIPEPATVCRAYAGDIPTCRDACTEQADCLRGGGERAETGQIDCVDGACTYVGCTSDAQCQSPAVCAAIGTGISECAFPCEELADCARHAQQELGLDGPDPNDPFTQEDIFVCRHGLCRTKVLGCSDDDDCAAIGRSGAVCELP